MDNQHKKISGYRDLSQAEIDSMNAVKALEAKFNSLIDRLRNMEGVDQRNAALAATHGEDAFMRAVRAIAQPARLTDDSQ
jgi:major membrane immunogen (membrane-anchored lipoprotein)